MPWVVMRLTSEWSWQAAGLNVKFDRPSGLVGLLPVYATLEDARREWPSADYMEIRKVADALEG